MTAPTDGGFRLASAIDPQPPPDSTDDNDFAGCDLFFSSGINSMTHSLRELAMASPGRGSSGCRNCRRARRQPLYLTARNIVLGAPDPTGEITRTAARTKRGLPVLHCRKTESGCLAVKRNSMVHDDQRKWSIAERPDHIGKHRQREMAVPNISSSILAGGSGFISRSRTASKQSKCR